METSLVTTGDNKMICQFCKKKCVKGYRERKRRWWHECDHCHVQFLTSLQGRIEKVLFKTKGEDVFYTLEVDLKRKKTNLSQLKNVNTKSHPSYSVDTIKEFEEVVNVTPENFNDKIKTYLIFL